MGEQTSSGMLIDLHVHESSANNCSDSTQKRKRDKTSSDISEHHKKYLWETSTLVKQNKYYLPDNTQNNTDQSTSQDTGVAKTKIPPIFIHNASNYQTVVDDIKETIDSEDFTVQCKTNSMKVNLFNSSDFRKLTAFYDEQKIQYHTFQNPDNTCLSVVMRNIPISVPEEQIKAELSKQFTVIKVTRLLNKEKLPMPLCVIDLQRNDKSDEIFNITRYDHSVISIEPRRKSKDIPQCTRCQRYGHTKNYCRLEPRCVKCTQNHHYSQCPRRPGEVPSCINCQGNHTANYRGCPFYIDLKTKINSRQHQRNKPEINPTNSQYFNQLPRPNLSATQSHGTNQRTYASATKNEQDPVTNIIKTLLEFITPYIDQIKQFISSLFTSMFVSNIQSK